MCISVVDKNCCHLREWSILRAAAAFRGGGKSGGGKSFNGGHGGSKRCGGDCGGGKHGGGKRGGGKRGKRSGCHEPKQLSF
jgi:hypothetical protein